MLDVRMEQMQPRTLLELLKRILQQKLHEQIPFLARFGADVITVGTLIVPTREIFIFVEDKSLAVALCFLWFRAISSVEFQDSFKLHSIFSMVSILNKMHKQNQEQLKFCVFFKVSQRICQYPTFPEIHDQDKRQRYERHPDKQIENSNISIIDKCTYERD